MIILERGKGDMLSAQARKELEDGDRVPRDRRQYSKHTVEFIEEHGERRVSSRRENDRMFGARIKRIFDIHMFETVSDEQVQQALQPVLEMVKSGKKDLDKKPIECDCNELI